MGWSLNFFCEAAWGGIQCRTVGNGNNSRSQRSLTGYLSTKSPVLEFFFNFFKENMQYFHSHFVKLSPRRVPNLNLNFLPRKSQMQ